MPLPAEGIAWPPAELAPITPALAAWSAWYSGDRDELHDAYRATNGAGGDIPRNRPAQYRGGVVGAFARWFWGAPSVDANGARYRLHVPIAADLCQASADLLYAEPPTITVDDPHAQDRLGLLLDDGAHTTLAEAAEISAALGGVYLRVAWDQDVAAAPFLTSVHADAAWPDWRWGRLAAVTFWHRVADTDRRVWRHVERHELDDQGVGIILHGLYEGTADNLGRRIPLDALPATAPLAALVDDDSAITTGSPGLAVVYVPNQRPQRRWRAVSSGAPLGRSDLDGVEPLMDALDETYTSWMRDVRLGKGRVFIAESMLDNLGPGQGAAWDSDREVYAPLKLLAGRDGSSLPIEAHQFAIRWAEHKATAEQWVGAILRTAGYSAQTFGEDDGSGGSATATEVTARQQRSFLTRDRKIRLQRPAVAAVVRKLLGVDAALFRGPGAGEGPVRVQFADGVQDSALTLAQTAQALRTANAASTRTLVRIVHPDWDDPAVDDEAAAILRETDPVMPDPLDDPATGRALTADAP